MSGGIITGTDVEATLDSLENYLPKNHLGRVQDYSKILSVLENNENLSLTETERLLKICTHDTKENMRYTTCTMKIISVVLSRVKMGKYDPCPDLLPSALAVIHIIKKSSVISDFDSLKQLCFETLLEYPNATLIAVLEHNKKILEICDIYCQSRTPPKLKMQVCFLLHRLLKILPPEKRRKLVYKELSFWFSKIIPTCMHLNVKQEKLVELLEVLAEELVAFDYTDNQHWLCILESICRTNKYPAVMKALLQNGSKVWHRVWIVFIKLLKHQVTQLQGTIGTPINSMLPVVEAAFKVDVENRCRAFECWTVLIDSFSTETNESNIDKRIKLLIIPLKSNNAKAEASALAKFKCWWHLILKFQNKINGYMDNIIVSFLHFCFGKYNVSDKLAIVPGQISTVVKRQCIQALVDMVGHVNCEGCTDLPKLNSKLINTKTLVDNWNQWVYSLTSGIMLSVTTDNGLTKQQMTCLWKSYLRTIGELPENNIRKDLFSEILSILLHLVKECKSNAVLSDIVLDALILSLFDEDLRTKDLLKTKTNDVVRPLCKIVAIILDPAMQLAYQSCGFEDMVKKLRPITDMVLSPVYSSPSFVTSFVVQNLTLTDMSLILWIALGESIIECDPPPFPCESFLVQTLMWPLQTIVSFTHVKTAAKTWHTMYNLFWQKLKNCEVFKKALTNFLYTSIEVTHSTTYFKLCVTLSILKDKIVEQSSSAYEKELELLHILTGRVDNYGSYEQLFPLMVDRIVATVSVIVKNINEIAARYILFCMKKILKVLTLTVSQQSITDPLILSLVDTILKSLDSVIQVELYQRFIPVIIDELIECSSFLSQASVTKNTVLIVMKTLKSKVDKNDVTFEKLKAVIDNIEHETKTTDKNQSSDKFTTPKTKEVKKSKKKEASIVDTVLVNGEEYVVVKSNWKFNPRKLTENQKEKLQQRREDIPALYQDLSQSQDECKLVAWKTDSQDVSNSSKSESKSETSKSANNETNMEIVLNQSSSNVVPKILENFISNNLKKDSPTTAKEIVPVDKTVNKIEATPKNIKSPRMALKDRVFRSVKNLLESSGVQNDNKSDTVDLNKTESIIKTPTQSKSDATANTVNSAPPMLAGDRPSRVKRKPKKFDELQLLVGAKKSRRSASQDLKSKDQLNQSQTDTTPSTIVTTLDAIPPNDTIPEENVVNKSNDALVPENVNITVFEGLPTDDNLQSDVNKKLIDIEIPMEEEPEIILDLEANDKTNDNPNELKVDSSTENNVESSDVGQNLESSTVINDKSSTENKVTEEKDQSSSEKKLVSSNDNNNERLKNKKGDVRNAVKDYNSNNGKKKSNDDQDQSTPDNKDKEISSEKKAENSIDSNNERFKNKKDHVSNAVKDNNSNNGKKKSNDNQDQSTPVEKDKVISNENKAESFNECFKNKKGHVRNAVKDNNSNNEKKKSNDNQDQSTPGDNDRSMNETNCEESDDKMEETSNTNNDANSTGNDKSPSIKEVDELSEQSSKNKGTEEQKSTTKKPVRKSRIEKELAIDMVEGHPFLKMQSQKRLTRKALESTSTGRRQSLVEKLNKSKSEAKTDKKRKEKNKDSDSSSSNSSLAVDDSQGQDTDKDQTLFTEDLPYSDDVIESSQDSTITTISVKSTNKANKKLPVVTLKKLMVKVDRTDKTNESQSILDCVNVGVPESAKSNQESKDDSELPLNTTASEGQSEADLTENMDTEPVEERDLSEVVMIISDDVPPPLTISSEESEVGPETQEIAEADTQPTDPNNFMETGVLRKETDTSLTVVTNEEISIKKINSLPKCINEKPASPPEVITITLSDSAAVELEKESGASSPSSLGDEAKRKQDFLNNTLEISPIKNMSPERQKKSPSPETSSDYVVITLSSPVNSNGEPLEKCGSPEVFTEDKTSPDKRDQSPPRVEVTVTNTSPSSSLSLKKNKPQVRAGGRAAQMLGLCCVPDKVQSIINLERTDTEEIKKTSSTSTPARRNLRILYNSVGENIEPSSENEDSEQFLKFRRSLPAVDSSPVGPILKRKLVEIADDATISPASKRKRVSFHDPPVSTTVSVQKYIEPGGVRSPQNSIQKRLERQLNRQYTPLKSPKRLDHAFKLDTVLNRAVESFTETSITSVISTPDDTQTASLDETPVVEIVRASELNDNDPICPDLVDCKDPIDNIAGELSSFAMKSLLVTELVGTVHTVGDLAKMTELEVNRLCIKAPKVKVARRVLTDYAVKRVEKLPCDAMVTIDEAIFDEPMPKLDMRSLCVDTEAQTVAAPTTGSSVQTDTIPTVHTDVQTDESGSKSTADIIKSCLAERPDFVQQVSEHLEDSSIQKITDKLPFSAITDVLVKKITPTAAKTLLNRVLENQWNNTPEENRGSKELSFIREYMCDRFHPKDLILFCSEVLKSVYDKP